jgi:hypothetical protein
MRKHMIYTITAITTLAIASLVGCGGGGSGGASTKTGYFIDSPVEGLEYTSGSTTGITGADGSFKYEEGKPVTFKIGSMVLGIVTVTNNKVFPVDLINGATDETDPKVSLMAQILQTLDSDGDPSNGITISETARRAITQTIEVATTDPSQTASVINLLLVSATTDRPVGSTNVLVSETNARTHLNSNLVKEFAGNWSGSFRGTDTGTCQTTISQVGVISGNCTSALAGNFTISGLVRSSGSWQSGGGGSSTPLSSNGSSVGSNGNGSASTGAVFEGNYSRSGTASGNWINSANHSGTWSMTKQ